MFAVRNIEISFIFFARLFVFLHKTQLYEKDNNFPNLVGSSNFICLQQQANKLYVIRKYKWVSCIL